MGREGERGRGREREREREGEGEREGENTHYYVVQGNRKRTGPQHHSCTASWV